MDSEKRQHLQDIYATDQSTKDDFTPQVASEIVEERKRDMRRHQFTSFMLGMVILILSVSLVYVVIREYIQIQTVSPSLTPITQEYIPRYSLPSEAQWVLDFPRNFGSPTWDGEGERPLNSLWIQKLAFNLILAEQATSVGENEEAAEYYENALEIFPDLEGVKVPLGSLYFKINDFDKALALLEDTSESDLTPDVLNNLGAACLNAKAYDRAENYLKQAIEVRPTYAEPMKNLAILYKKQNREKEAVSAYETYLDLRPMDLDTQHNFALYLTKLGLWDEAATQLNHLTEEITDVPLLYFLLARAETHNKRPEKAMAAIRRGMQLTDPSAALAHMNSDEFDQLRESDEFQLLIQSVEAPR